MRGITSVLCLLSAVTTPARLVILSIYYLSALFFSFFPMPFCLFYVFKDLKSPSFMNLIDLTKMIQTQVGSNSSINKVSRSELLLFLSDSTLKIGPQKLPSCPLLFHHKPSPLKSSPIILLHYNAEQLIRDASSDCLLSALLLSLLSHVFLSFICTKIGSPLVL